jgi:hypothetical protein
MALEAYISIWKIYDYKKSLAGFSLDGFLKVNAAHFRHAMQHESDSCKEQRVERR